MGVPSVSGIAKESPGSAEPGSDREVLAVEMSLSLLQSPREGHSTSRAGCSKAWCPFQPSPGITGMILGWFLLFCLLAAQGAALSAGYKKWDRMNYFPGSGAGVCCRRSQFFGQAELSPPASSEHQRGVEQLCQGGNLGFWL